MEVYSPIISNLRWHPISDQSLDYSKHILITVYYSKLIPQFNTQIREDFQCIMNIIYLYFFPRICWCEFTRHKLYLSLPSLGAYSATNPTSSPFLLGRLRPRLSPFRPPLPPPSPSGRSFGQKNLIIKFFEWMKMTTEQIRLQKRGGFEWISSLFKIGSFV